MAHPDEIEALKRRLGALEYELTQLKRSLAAIEAADAQARAAAAAPPPVKPAAPANVVPPVEPPPIPVRRVETPAWQPSPIAAQVARASATATATVHEPSRHPLREWLEPLQLWPPHGEENAEVRLAAWWATRLGALLAVIGVVFLGIYVSKDSPPWVRLLEVIGVTAGVLALGSWLERKLPKFGAVMFGAGLALTYFCAFAAYAVPAMKVIASPVAATACELIVVGGIFGLAWRRNSPLVATMAVALGYVTAFLAVRNEPIGFGPWVVLLLGAVAVTLRLVRGWEAPSALAMPLTWLFLAATALAEGVGRDMAVHAVWVWCALHLALFMGRDWFGVLRGGNLSALDRGLQVTNSSLAVTVGLLAAWREGGDLVTQYYFGSGAVMLLAAWAWQRVRTAALVPVLVCKGSGLIALGVIDAFAGQARSLVLLAQAFVMLVGARQSRQSWLRTATVVVGLVAFALFVSEIRLDHAPFATAATALEMIFLAGAVTLIAALHRWVEWPTPTAVVGCVGLAAATVLVASAWQVPGWTPSVLIGAALVLVAAAAIVRGWMAAAVAGGLVFVAAHASMWVFEAARYSRALVWYNELALFGTALLAATPVSRIGDAALRRAVQWLLGTLATATLVLACFKALEAPVALAAAMAVALALTAFASRASGWPLAALATLPMALGGVVYFVNGGSGASAALWFALAAAWAVPLWIAYSRARFETIRAGKWRTAARGVQTSVATVVTLIALFANLKASPSMLVAGSTLSALVVFAFAWRTPLRPALEATWVLWNAVALVLGNADGGATSWFAAGSAWLPAIALVRMPAPDLLQPPPPWRGRAVGIQLVIATLLGVIVAFEHRGAAQFAALGVVLAIAVAVWRWLRVPAARRAGVTLAALAWLIAVWTSLEGHAQGWSADFAAVMAVAAVCTVLPFAIEREVAARRVRARWFAAVGGLLLAFAAVFTQRGALAPYVTVGAGAVAVAIFLTGLFGRSRPHRLAGLAGIALCVPRAFFVDLDSTLHRIAAFVALGVVLLWVGFSYHRFRHLIVDEETKT